MLVSISGMMLLRVLDDRGREPRVPFARWQYVVFGTYTAVFGPALTFVVRGPAAAMGVLLTIVLGYTMSVQIAQRRRQA